ncbi:hypothetical protein ABYF34_01085 [Buchananella felis]|uniref:hypothetical protein n=1 Tax=Buchananella felis TaxID=3231492 RepID=UPI003526CBEF
MHWQLWTYGALGATCCALGAGWLWRLLPSLARNYLGAGRGPDPRFAPVPDTLRLCLPIGVFWAALVLLTLPAPAGLLLATPLLFAPALALLDAESHKLPDTLTSALWASQSALLLAATSGLLGPYGLSPASIAIAALAWLALAVAGLAAAAFPLGIGLGDAKLAAPIGATLAALSPALLWAWLTLAVVLAGAWAGIGLATGRYGWRQSIAFGPPLLLSLGLLAAALAA